MSMPRPLPRRRCPASRPDRLRQPEQKGAGPAVRREERFGETPRVRVAVTGKASSPTPLGAGG